MTKEEFLSELKKLNIKVTGKMLEQLTIYMEFLIEYNKHTNLTAIADEEGIYLKHFYDSLTIVKTVDLSKQETLIDIGTGAGFPGMVLKIFYPHLAVTLLDSNNKKTKFLNLLKEKLNIDVNVVNMRVEEYAKSNLNSFDVVTSRAVANLRVLAEITLPLVKVKGLFIALKGRLDDSLEDSKTTIELMNGKIIEQLKFELYNSAGTRNIVVVEKQRETELANLRPYDKIIKKPLKKKMK